MTPSESAALHVLVMLVLASRPEPLVKEGAVSYINGVVEHCASAHQFLYQVRDRLKMALDPALYATVAEALQFEAIAAGTNDAYDQDIEAAVAEALATIKEHGIYALGVPGQERGEA